MIRLTLFHFLFFVVYCESKQSLVPQAILQLVESHYGESCVKIEVFYNSDRIKILDETLKILSEVKELKITEIIQTDLLLPQVIHGFYNDAIFIFDTVTNYQKFFNDHI